MEYDKLLILLQCKYQDKLIATFKEFVEESLSITEVRRLVEEKINVLKHLSDLKVTRSCYLDKDFNTEVDIIDGEVFILEHKTVLVFFFEKKVKYLITIFLLLLLF